MYNRRSTYLEYLVSADHLPLVSRQRLAASLGSMRPTADDAAQLELVRPTQVEELRQWPAGTIWQELCDAKQRGEIESVEWVEAEEKILVSLARMN